jgi:hypothetical protein
MTNKKNSKKLLNFSCKICNFNCSNKQDYTRHLLTAKHKILTNPNEKTPKNSAAYICDCGKKYKHVSSLCNHKRTCFYDNKNINTEAHDDELYNTTTEPTSEASTVLMLLKQNEEFKQLMVEQHNENLALQQKLVDVVKDGNGTVINNNTTNNNHFNLNFFLNDTCKDAMNITDFLGNLDVQIDEIEYIGNHGYVNGMTKMIMKRLKGMDITKRPIHCTDIKRETMYIKDKDEWSKDTEELTKLRKILNRITMNNCRAVPKWKSAHPDCEVMDTRNNEFCYKMMRLMLGDVEEAQVKLDNKIIKTMAKDLFCK